MLWGTRLFAVALAAFVIGSAVAVAATVGGQTEETRICPDCGAEIPVTFAFCTSCHCYLPDGKLDPEKEFRKTAAVGGREGEPARRFFTARLVGNYMGGEKSNVAGCFLTFGFRLSDLLVLGPGVGFQDYAKDYDNVESVPMFVSLRGNFSRGTFSPLICGRVGYNKARYKKIGYPFAGDEDPSGPFIGFGGGFDILGGTGLGFTVEAGVQFEYMKEYWVLYFPYTRQFSPVYERRKVDSYFKIAAGVVL